MRGMVYNANMYLRSTKISVRKWLKLVCDYAFDQWISLVEL